MIKNSEIWKITLLAVLVVIVIFVAAYTQYRVNKERFPSAPAWTHWFK